MGRLNYTNRKCEGEKLGEIIAKDLIKRIPPNAGSKAALRDPVVELDVSGRSLTSSGFNHVFAALVKAMGHQDEHGRVLRLEELCLRDSRLDNATLPLLAQLVSMAGNDLRDLDLSENSFTIDSGPSTAAWEIFLDSLASSCVLRRIDLSGNGLGPRAFEIFTRVYARECPIDPMLLTEGDVTRTIQDFGELQLRARGMSDLSNTNLSDAHLEADHAAIPGGNEHSRHECNSSGKSNSMMGNKESRQVYASTYGLRSVPYLIFSATSMTETCALHLSYVVTHHGMPEQLLRYVPAAKAGAPAQQLQTYSHTAGCRGLIYDSNPSLGVAGMKVLDLAEIVRQHRFSDGDEDDKEGAFEAISPAARLRNKTRRISDTRRGSSAANHRFSNSSTGGTEYAYVSRENAVAELDRARSRIQGNALHEAGPCSNDLWHVALRMLNIGRIIRPISKREPPLLRTKRAEDVQSRGFGFGSPKHSTFSTTALAPKNPNQSINHNIGQWRLEDSKLVPVMAPEPASKKPSPPPSPHLMKPQNAPYKTQLPLGFSQEVWRRIIAFSVNANEILTENQQRSVMKWAMDRSTLNRERESLGLKQSAQIWKVLEGMECLAYEINT